MYAQTNRRHFLATSTLAAAGMMFHSRLWGAAPSGEPALKTTPHKAMIGHPSEEVFKKWKLVGIEGMETAGPRAWQMSPVEAAKLHLAAEQLDMRVPSVMFGWANVNDPDSGKVARDIENVTAALGAAAGYGADAVLLVPCKIQGMAMPKPWEFDIRFDERTGRLEQVVAGDNSKYKTYIEAHNHATQASRKAIERLLPVAERTGVVIAVENVWNNLWVKPDLFANFIASFNSHWVKAYYDVANGIVYAPPEEWIRTLGRLIVKVHIKDFRLNPNGQGGQFVNIRDNGVNWPSVRGAFDQIGYNGWMTLEGSGRLPLAEQAKRFDLILAGK